MTDSIPLLISKNLVSYPDALHFMESHVASMINGQTEELVWFLEHPPLLTKGSSGKEEDLLDKKSLPIFESNRGGQLTYHGPGQRIIYPMLRLQYYRKDVRSFVQFLENWIIEALSRIGVNAFTSKDRIGVWVKVGHQEKKIAAIGIRLRKWVSYHGIALNINPNLDHFGKIIPCGLREYGVTSLAELGIPISLPEMDQYLIQSFPGRRLFLQT